MYQQNIIVCVHNILEVCKKKGPTSIFPLIATPKQRKEPKVRGSLPPPAKRMRSDDFETSKPIADSLVEEVSSLRQVVSKLV